MAHRLVAQYTMPMLRGATAQFSPHSTLARSAMAPTRFQTISAVYSTLPSQQTPKPEPDSLHFTDPNTQNAPITASKPKRIPFAKIATNPSVIFASSLLACSATSIAVLHPDPLNMLVNMGIGSASGFLCTLGLGSYTTFMNKVLNSSQQVDWQGMALELREKSKDPKAPMTKWEAFWTAMAISEAEREQMTDKIIQLGIVRAGNSGSQVAIYSLCIGLGMPPLAARISTGLLLGGIEVIGFGAVDAKIAYNALKTEILILRLLNYAKQGSENKSSDAELQLYRSLNALLSIQGTKDTLDDVLRAISDQAIQKVLENQDIPQADHTDFQIQIQALIKATPSRLKPPTKVEELRELARGGTAAFLRDMIGQIGAANFLADSSLGSNLFKYIFMIGGTNLPSQLVIDARQKGETFQYRNYMDLKILGNLTTRKLMFRLLLTYVSLATILTTRTGAIMLADTVREHLSAPASDQKPPRPPIDPSDELGE
jgi:hypothetical protein